MSKLKVDWTKILSQESPFSLRSSVFFKDCLQVESKQVFIRTHTLHVTLSPFWNFIILLYSFASRFLSIYWFYFLKSFSHFNEHCWWRSNREAQTVQKAVRGKLLIFYVAFMFNHIINVDEKERHDEPGPIALSRFCTLTMHFPFLELFLWIFFRRFYHAKRTKNCRTRTDVATWFILMMTKDFVQSIKKLKFQHEIFLCIQIFAKIFWTRWDVE